MRRSPCIDCDCSISLNGLDSRLLKAAQRYLDCLHYHKTPCPQDVQDWAELFLICDPLLRRFATSFHVPSGDLDDCVQSAWKEIVIALPTFQDAGQPGRLAAWLRHIVHSKAVDIHRYQARHPARPLPPNLETSQIDQHEDRAAELEQDNHRARIQRVLATMSRRLPGTSYRVFQLRCIEGRTVQEVAEELHLSTRQVHYRCHRMRQKFRHFYEQDLRAGDVGLQ